MTEILLAMDIDVINDIEMDLYAVSFAPMVGRWTLPVKEHLIFNTEILQSHDRTEQRIARRRGVAANYFSTKIFLEGNSEMMRFEAIIHSWLRKKWRVPLWPQADIHSGALPAGSSSINFDTRFADFRDNSYAVIWQDRYNNEVILISSKTDSDLTFSGVTANSYSGNKFIMPCRIGRCLSAARPVRYGGGAMVDIEFRIEDIEAVTGFAADMTYDGYTVLTEPAKLFRNIADVAEYSHDPDIALLDAGTGPFEVVRNADFNLVNQPHGWVCESKQDAWELRQFFYYIAGRQRAFLVPTFRWDLQLSRPVGPDDTNLYINNINLAANMGVNDLRKYLAFQPPAASIISRKIIAIDFVSNSEEKITINTKPEIAFDAGDYLYFVDICRLASDEIELNWYGRGKCTADIPLIRVTS